MLLVFVYLLALIYFGYESTILFFARHFYAVDKLEKIRALFSINTYRYVIVILSVIESGLIISYVKFENLYSSFRNVGLSTIHSLDHRLRHDWSGPLLFLMVIPVSMSIYLCIKMPVSYDEAWTYLNFSSKSILTSISYYPAPNNHVLYSILTNIFVLLPVSHLAAIRMPSVLVNIMCILFLFSLVKEYCNVFIAYITIAFFSTFSMTIYYSYMSRGYGLECLFFVLMTYSVFKIINNPENKLYWFYFSIASIGGFYTIPSFLYPFVIANTYLFIALKKIGKNQVTSSMTVMIVSGLLYLPIILLNGLHALTNNSYVTPISRLIVVETLPSFFLNVFSGVTGLPALIVIALCCAGILILLSRYKGHLGYYFLLILIMSPVLLALHSVIPFPRTFEYYNCIISFLIALIVYEMFKSIIEEKYLFVGLLALQIFLSYSAWTKILESESYAIGAQKNLPLLSDGRNFFICSHLFDSYLIFDLKQRKVTNYTLKFVLAGKTKINIDTVSGKHYDFYILDNSIDGTRGRVPLVKNEFYSIYK